MHGTGLSNRNMVKVLHEPYYVAIFARFINQIRYLTQSCDPPCSAGNTLEPVAVPVGGSWSVAAPDCFFSHSRLQFQCYKKVSKFRWEKPVL